MGLPFSKICGLVFGEGLMNVDLELQIVEIMDTGTSFNFIDYTIGVLLVIKVWAILHLVL